MRNRVVLLLATTFGVVVAVRADEQQGRATITEPAVTEADRGHWSFRPLKRPELPRVRDAAWPAGEIDRFILARLEAKELAPMPPAARRTLIRRVTFDLTGLPPTPAVVDAFVADESPAAYEDLVDRLLASPAYGERWAQHWLDLARWAETDGFEHDKLRPQAWRYRDWVIKALNDDLPYDRFVALQLAGDELQPRDELARVATGFCLSGPDMPDVNSQDERRHELLNEMTSTVGSVFLGLQVGCAQCHDHKYDPISQLDFYRLRAVFQPAVQLARDKSVGVLAERGQPKPAHLMVRGDWRRPGPKVQPAFPRIANPWNDVIDGAPAGAATTGRRAALARWMTRPDHPLTTRVIANRLWHYHFGRGLCGTPSDVGLLGDEPYHVELVDWLATELVRRKWSLKAMHKLIVTSSTYRQAGRTTEPTYSDEQRRQAQKRHQRLLAADPDNHLWGRAPRRRLQGEAIRDAMLAAAGSLSPRRGGPGVRPPLPEEVVATLLRRDHWQVSKDEEDHRRRSIYVLARRNLRYPIFEAFDRPDANASCARRSRSTTAPQSLFLLNSRFSLDMARRLAGKVLSDGGKDPGEQVTLCFRLALSRRPTAGELAAGKQFLASQRDLLKRENRAVGDLALPEPAPRDADHFAAAALVDLCLAVYNLSEFIYVD